MKQALLSVGLILIFKISIAQFYDKTWLVGSSTMVTLRFHENTFDTASFYQVPSTLPIVISSSNISDTNGSLLFYCNGTQIGNALGHIMENGDTLIDSLFYNDFQGGFTEPQTNIILPKRDSTYYLFYYSTSDSLYGSNTIQEPDRLYYAVVDMNANSGLGKVISKKNIAYRGLFGDCRLTACRHANGRDWWLVHQGYETNEYFIYLVTPDSVYAPHIQHIGPSDFYLDNGGGQSAFSPDGSKFATGTDISPLVIMDFDRCIGIFSNPDTISVAIDTTYCFGGQIAETLSGSVGTCFSASGRFLYINNDIDIIQYDTWAANIAASATYITNNIDSFCSNTFLGFYDMYLMPNGQIIISDANSGSNTFHIIDSPDVQGVGCHFLYYGLPVNTLSTAGVPNMINYRLGALPGCALSISEVEESQLKAKVYPNPATKVTQLDIANRDLNESMSFVLYDMLGQVILRKNIAYYEIEISRNGISSGIYTWQVQNGIGQTKAAGKMVWE